MHKVSKHAREAAAASVVLSELRSIILSGTFDHHPMAQMFAEFEKAVIERCAEVVKACDLARGIPEDPSQIITDLAAAIRAQVQP